MKKMKNRIFKIIQIGNREDIPSTIFDVFIIICIVCNLAVVLLTTFSGLAGIYDALMIVDFITVVIFSIEYVLRVWTADLLYPEKTPVRARIRFIFSFYGLIDLFTILPFFLPIILPQGAVAFRVLRVIRILRLFQINSSYDAYNAITDVLKRKRGQLLSSISMVLILMVASSLCMYSLEHEVQPEAFENAFSGIWWSVSTLLTVGYGDIYPVTLAGKIMAIFISFLGVGMVAIPTGIISAGFVEVYGKAKQGSDKSYIEEVIIDDIHPWVGRTVRELNADALDIVTMIIRGDERVAAKNDMQIQVGDHIIVYRVEK